jgi:hypothetical protein
VVVSGSVLLEFEGKMNFTGEIDLPDEALRRRVVAGVQPSPFYS